ncbi:MAG TPA: hypothetical protein DD666_09310 [Advenella kashmirensis]|uniref:Uncharacterized protein n=1 Tax=Advenella kashmirensis TaxID=310575 RepID=A0A356LFR0_9BURK|nr:hypothetical protein [Advenella kashmirensis]
MTCPPGQRRTAQSKVQYDKRKACDNQKIFCFIYKNCTPIAFVGAAGKPRIDRKRAGLADNDKSAASSGFTLAAGLWQGALFLQCPLPPNHGRSRHLKSKNRCRHYNASTC